MKRILSLLLILVMILSSCAAKPEPKEPDSVSITLPAEIFSGTTDEEIKELTSEEGILAINRLENGDIELVMSKQAQREALDGLKENIDSIITSLVDDSNQYSSFSDITFKDNLSEFTILADKASFQDREMYVLMGFYISGVMYQMLTGERLDEIDVTVEVLDKDTKEVINSESFREMRQNE